MSQLHLPSGEHKTGAEQPRKGNLPVQLTPFVGREEVKRAAIGHLLRDDVPLLTLIGPPGIGKTRLSLEVAAALADHFRDGVWFVNLAPVSDALLVASTIAYVLGLKQLGGRSWHELLLDYLHDKQMLLLLDNFEQIVDAAPFVAEFLSTAPGVKALATSREALRVRGEQEFPVPPLTLPNLDHLPSAAQVSQFEAVQLFAQRARSTNLDFQITDDNALVVAAICWRLDGLPLAIELAAARTKLLPPQALFERLQQRLLVLTGGARDLPPRHRALRSAIDWSYNLLDEDEQTLFRRLGVFVGGCRWDAVDTVCNADGSIRTITLEGISTLIEKSLVQQTQLGSGGEPRLMMLETIKAYALEQLEASHETAEIRQGHALYFLGLAELWNERTLGQEAHWLERLDDEKDNLRAALHWMRQETENGRLHGEAEIALRMAAAMYRFWYIRGYLSEGRDWLLAMLRLAGAEKHAELQSRVLGYAGRLAYVQCDYRTARSQFEECLALSREIGYKLGVVFALEGIGEVDTEEGDYVSASARFQESLAISKEIGEDRMTASILNNRGYVALRTGNYAAAMSPFEECLKIYRREKDARGIGFALQGLGETALRLGDYPQATGWLRDSLKIREELGDKWGLAISLASLGWMALLQDDYVEAAEMLCRSLLIRRDIGDVGGLAWCMEKLADLSRKNRQIGRAVCLLGIAKALRDSVGSVIDLTDQPAYDRNIVDMRARLGDAMFATAWSEGIGMSLDEALQYALRIPPTQPADATSPPHLPDFTTLANYDGLTRRECEVAELIAQSKSNPEIAAALVVSKRTVETHVANILSKLSFSSRGQIASWAISKKADQSS